MDLSPQGAEVHWTEDGDLGNWRHNDLWEYIWNLVLKL